MKWSRKCPECGKRLYYSNKYHLKYANRLNKVCLSCSHNGQIPWCKGKTFSKLHRTHLSKSHEGQVSWNKGKCLSESHIQNLKAKHAGFSSYEEYVRLYPEKQRYVSDVWTETRKQLKQNPPLPNFEKRGRAGTKGAYQLDHIISIDEGFKKRINPKKIGAYSNLRIISWEENLSKKNKGT